MVRKITESDELIKKEYTVWELECMAPWSRNKKIFSYSSEQAALDAIDRLTENNWKVYSISKVTRKVLDNDSDYSIEPKFAR